jgi:hypothetical protein
MKKFKKYYILIINLVLLFWISSFASKIHFFNYHQSSEKVIEKKFKLDESISNQPERKLYVSCLSFLDVIEQKPIGDNETETSIYEAVIKGMSDANVINKKLSIDRDRHKIPNSYENKLKLSKLIFDLNLSIKEKAEKIINSMMIPENIDILISGYFVNDRSESNFHILPFLIHRGHKKIIISYLYFKKSDFFCTNSQKNRKVLCEKAFRSISNSVKNLLENL